MIEELVKQIETRFAELGEQMTDPEVIADRERYAEVGRAYRQLEPAAKLAAQWRAAQDDAAGAEELLAEDGRRRRSCARSSAARASAIEELEEQIRLAMVERDPNDEKNVIVEIQGGAGGEEAGLWAGDLYRMLDPLRRAPRLPGRADGRRRRQVHVRDQGRRRLLGVQVRGRHPPRAARARRPSPRGASTPRPRPSRCCPRPRTSTSQIDPNDLQIDVYRSSGPGGQSVNTTDSAVRITHKPIGIVVSMQDEKSQLQNREKALRVLRARLYERALAEQQAELAADRRSQVGTGDRAEKIRTYNYGERRVTDHRIKLTVHNLDQVLEGELDELTDALQADEKRRRLEAQAAA